MKARALAVELLYILWIELTLVDWLWSSADPYPYGASIGTSVAVLVGFFAVRLRPGRRGMWILCACFAGASLLAAREWSLPALGAAVASGFVAWEIVRAGRSPRPTPSIGAGVILLVSCGLIALAGTVLLPPLLEAWEHR